MKKWKRKIDYVDSVTCGINLYLHQKLMLYMMVSDRELAMWDYIRRYGLNEVGE